MPARRSALRVLQKTPCKEQLGLYNRCLFVSPDTKQVMTWGRASKPLSSALSNEIMFCINSVLGWQILGEESPDVFVELVKHC